LLLLLLLELLDLGVALGVAGTVTTTVWPGDMLVTTVDAPVVADGSSPLPPPPPLLLLLLDDELDAGASSPPALGTLLDSPVRYTEKKSSPPPKASQSRSQIRRLIRERTVILTISCAGSAAL
jgi:hypothetical protein